MTVGFRLALISQPRGISNDNEGKCQGGFEPLLSCFLVITLARMLISCKVLFPHMQHHVPFDLLLFPLKTHCIAATKVIPCT